MIVAPDWTQSPAGTMTSTVEAHQNLNPAVKISHCQLVPCPRPFEPLQGDRDRTSEPWEH